MDGVGFGKAGFDVADAAMHFAPRYCAGSDARFRAPCRGCGAPAASPRRDRTPPAGFRIRPRCWRQPSSAAASLSATTAATRWPMKRTTCVEHHGVVGDRSSRSWWRAVEKATGGASSWVSTACTPGTASAASLLMARMRACACGERSKFHVQQALDRDIEREARLAGDHVGPGRRRHAVADGLAGCGVFDVAHAADGVLDRADSRCSGRYCPSARGRGRRAAPG